MDTLLQHLNFIHPLSASLKKHLRSILKWKEIGKKDFLLRAGEVCSHIYFVQKGLLRCFYIDKNSEVCSWFMKEGDMIIAVNSFFEQQPSLESIQALEPCELYYISYDELQFIYKKYIEFNFTGRVLTEKYYTLSEQRAHELRALPGVDRYNSLKKQEPDLITRVPAKYLASYLGITEVYLSNIKKYH